MNRSRFLPLLALAIVACTPTVGTSSGPAPATSEYRKLLVRLQAKDTSIDFTALRLAYAASPDYAPYGSDADDHRDSLSAALARRDYRTRAVCSLWVSVALGHVIFWKQSTKTHKKREPSTSTSLFR